ncbi:hypothetical protein HMPREF0972_00442 [Actinomyces sp. oral taxon 848 str. F0332]|nr:hypothetical protein HMPREF0972_00442 [Actinomyces sp. oral taxon 848 str. F0332]
MRFHSISFLLRFCPPNGGGQNINRSVEILAVVAVGFDRQNNTFLNFTVNSYLL